MTRIFLPPDGLTADTISITGDNARHLALVLRVQPGDAVTVFDGTGRTYECSITAVHKKEVQATVISREACSVESPLSITLAQGIARGDRMDLVIQKATELGVYAVIPVVTARSQIRHTDRTGRWKKIALSAAQQSGRDRVPEIGEPVGLDEFLGQEITPSALILSETHHVRNLKKVLTGLKDRSSFTLLVGPEGGFSNDEIAAAVEKGFQEVSLGPRILRTETAPLAALSIVQYELGDMG